MGCSLSSTSSREQRSAANQQLYNTVDSSVHTLQLELSEAWPTVSVLSQALLLRAIKAVNILIADQASFNRVYLPICKTFSQVNINIDAITFYNSCMSNNKVMVAPSTAYNIPSLNEQSTLMLVDDALRDTIIVNQHPFHVLTNDSTRFCILVICLMHELAHILTPTFNDLVSDAREKGTPGNIGVIRTNEKARQDCGYEMERLLFGGFLMFRDDGKVIFYVIKDTDLPFSAPNNVIGRPIKEAAIYTLETLLEKLPLGTDRFPIEEMIKLLVSQDSLHNVDTQEEGTTPKGTEGITFERARINMFFTGAAKHKVQKPHVIKTPKNDVSRDIEILLARRGVGRVTPKDQL